MPYVITCKDKTDHVYYVSRDMCLDENNHTSYYSRTELIGNALVMYDMSLATKTLSKERKRTDVYDFYKICNITAYPLNMFDEEAAIEFCGNHNCDECPASCNPDIRSAYEKDELFIPCFVNLLDEEAALDYIEESKEFNK